MKVIDLHEQVVRGEYAVDPHAIADAIVRRVLGERRPGTATPNDHSD